MSPKLTLICLFIFAFCSFNTQAQSRTISGRLTAKDGSPLPGVSIIIKGTQIGTVTDVNGNYSIDAPIGSTLVFSFIGMTTKELVVTEDKLAKAKPSDEKAPRDKKDTTKKLGMPATIYADTIVDNAPGVSVFSGKTSRHNFGIWDLQPGGIRSIRKIGKSVIISNDQNVYTQVGSGAQFLTTIGVETINRLPEFQTEYVQGRPVNGIPTHRGPESKEIFSWGPSRGSVDAYSPLSFFRKGYSYAQELTLLSVTKRGSYSFDVDHKTRSGVIPNSNYERINVAAGVKNLQVVNSLKANAFVSFNQSSGRLLSRGANLATIVGSVFRTPISFDNETGSSHAPGLVDNPNKLVDELPDNEKLRRIMGSLGFTYEKRDSDFTLNVTGSIDNQRNDVVFGMPAGYSGYPKGRLTDRNLDQTTFNTMITPALTVHYDDYWRAKFTGSYKMSHSNIQLARVDAFNFLNNQYDSTVNLNRSLSRTFHEISVFGHIQQQDWFHTRVSMMSYFSNTTNVNKYVNLFPSASASIDFVDLLYFLDGFNTIKLYGNILRTVRETPMIYSNWSYASLNYDPQQYSSFYEAGELFFRNGLSPERETKFESGLNVEYYPGHLTLDVVYFNNTTKDFIAPIVNNSGFQLNNVGKINNYGTSVSLAFSNSYYTGFRFTSSLRWSRYNSVAREVYDKSPVALAGFNTLQSRIIEGQPVGAIYGSMFKRDAEGNVVTDNQGFPVKDSSLKMIGNPIPDYTLNLYSKFEYKQFRLSFSLEYKKGGDVWNGTRASLDYLGRSKESGEDRTDASYDRYTRYGWDGVGENYIEDASWFRLNEVVFSYSTRVLRRLLFLRQIEFELVGRNLFVITPYSGVDPQATLFGYSNGSGLDMFNIPSTRSMNFQVKLKM